MRTEGHSRYAQSNALLERAQRVIPLGIWGHNRFPSTLDMGHYPHFARRGNGATFEDVDGNQYIDWICGYGAIILGHGRKEVDAAVDRAQRHGECLSLATETTIELAERVTKLVSGAAWTAFGKSGSDATWIALTVARAHTGRSAVICVDGAYHGSHGWCGWCNFGAGRPEADANAVKTVPWGDLTALEAMLARAEQAVAAVIVTPFHHPIPGPAAMPAAGYLDSVTEISHRHGAVVILDDVRAGFRLNLRGSHVALGGNPDLICFSKAIANGYALGAVVGTDAMRDAAESVFIAGTFWNSPGAMAGAIATLDILESESVARRIGLLGESLANGLESAGRAAGIPICVTGPPQMPTVTIDQDDGSQMMRLCRFLVANGVFVHPGHNWFVSAAHNHGHVERTVALASKGLRNLV